MLNRPTLPSWGHTQPAPSIRDVSIRASARKFSYTVLKGEDTKVPTTEDDCDKRSKVIDAVLARLRKSA